MRQSQSGVSLIETMVAVLISMFMMTALGGVIFTATVTNKNQGVEMSRVTVYSQDKIETLMNLDWYGCTEETPEAGCNTTGIDDASWNLGLKAGGTLKYQSECPESGDALGYIDYLDSSGTQVTGSSCKDVGSFAYQRQWMVVDVLSSVVGQPGMKRIDVMVWSRNAVNTGSEAPSALLTSYISE